MHDDDALDRHNGGMRKWKCTQYTDHGARGPSTKYVKKNEKRTTRFQELDAGIVRRREKKVQPRLLLYKPRPRFATNRLPYSPRLRHATLFYPNSKTMPPSCGAT